MKKFKEIIRYVLVFGIYATGLPSLRLWLKKRQGPVVRVIAYHDIDSISDFRRQVLYINDRFNIINPEDFVNCNFSRDKLNILITFDDGYKSWVEANKVLTELGVGAIFFVCSGFVDTAGDKKQSEKFLSENLNLQKYREPISWGEVQELLNRNRENRIGGHTKNHQNLAEISSDETRVEISDDKKRIESKIDQGIMYFAYPYGRKEVMSELANKTVFGVGYSYTFTTEFGFVIEKESPGYTVSRTQVEPRWLNRFLGIWITGSMDILKFKFF